MRKVMFRLRSKVDVNGSTGAIVGQILRKTLAGKSISYMVQFSNGEQKELIQSSFSVLNKPKRTRKVKNEDTSVVEVIPAPVHSE